jgi:hypothetical protein
MSHESRTVDLEDAKSVNSSVQTSAGQLTISGGSSRLLDADFGFSDSYASPRVDYHIDSGVGQLTISQDDRNTHFRDLLLTRLRVDMGAGQVDVDLTGNRKKDLDADIEGGVGQATIRLPTKVGVVVHASGGLGTINAHGLKHEGDEYSNDAYGKTPATIHLKVQGGIGQINLIQEP